MLNKSAGFTLLETLLALIITSIIVLAAASFLPALSRHNLAMSMRNQLIFEMHQLILGIEKDIRRAGFCAGNCVGKALLISQAPGEVAASCVIVAYDLNRNGHFENSAGYDAEYFGYRLRKGALESQRGVRHCSGNGWERVLDDKLILLKKFTLAELPARSNFRLLLLTLEGYVAAHPQIHYRLQRIITKEKD